jgi:hypothetical protein
MADPRKSSLSGLQTLVELAKATRDMAAARGFVNLVARFNGAIDDAERAPALPPADPVRVHVFSRLSDLQRLAMGAFRDDCDVDCSA